MNKRPQTKDDVSFAPLFGMAYNPVSVSAFGYLSLPSLEFGSSDQHTSFM
jgi:hypothetical protein